MENVVSSGRLLEGCHGDGCANAADAKAGGRSSDMVPLCLSCLRRTLEGGCRGDFEVAVFFDRLGSVARLLAELPLTEPMLRVGVSAGKAVTLAPRSGAGQGMSSPPRCAFESCPAEPIATIGPMLRPDDRLAACELHLPPATLATPHPEIRPISARLLPAVADAVNSIGERLIAIQIFFAFAAGESAAPEPAAVAADPGKVDGEHPFLIF